MRTKRILRGILVLFAVLALSATGLHAAEQENRIVAVHSIGTLDGSGFSITDDFAVADGCEEIKYDDGTAEGVAPGIPGFNAAVHFTITNPDYNALKTARFYLVLNDSISDHSFDWKVLEWTNGAPGSVIASGTTDPAEQGWCEVDMGNIDVPEDFAIAIYWKHELALDGLGCDEDATIDERSLLYLMGTWIPCLDYDHMIQAVVCGDDVGGPDINVTPVELEARLEPGETASKTLNICNKGDGVLTYSSISVSCDDAPESKTATIGAPGLEKIGKGIRAISAGEEIRYDDGDSDGAYYSSTIGIGMAVHFTSQDHDKLNTARFYLFRNESILNNSFDWEVLGWTESEPGSIIKSGTTTPTETDDWHDVDVGEITVPEDFVIAIYWKQGYAPSLGYDNSTPIDKRSFAYYNETWHAWPYEVDLMIRAVMDGGNGCGWISVDATSGTVAPGDCDEIVVTIDATGLEPGSYNAAIVISSDDSDEGTVTVPVTLDVIDKTTVDPPESAGNEVYFNPQRSIAELNKTNEVDIRVNATNFRSGQLNITYPSEYANVTDWALNKDDFSRGLCTLTPGGAWITFVASGQLTGECTIGTLTIQRVEDACHTAQLVFVEPSLLCNNSGQEIEVEWNNGIFTCDGVCGDVNEDGVVDIPDVTCLLDHVNLPFAYPICEWCGDVTGDGVIDIRDVTLLLNHVDNQEGCPLCCR